MKVTAHKTHKITVEDDLYRTLDEHLPQIEERTVVVITSKIVSICNGDVVKDDGTINKEELIKKNADWYFTDDNLKVWGTVIPTITKDVLIANAGIDESNANGYFIIWPQNIDAIADAIWNHLREKHKVKNLGVIITDSHVAPMRYGTLGVAISWSGFKATEDYRGKPDIFGRPLEMTQKNLIDGFAAAAVTVMGEGEEQTPLATITDIPFVEFQDHSTTQAERDEIKIEKEKDIFGKLLTSIEWEKGERKK